MTRPDEASRRAPAESFSDADLETLARHGLSEEDLKYQLDLLRGPATAVDLGAPCTPGHGIEVLPEDEKDALLEAWRSAALEGRITKFVPASGKASRMFGSLTTALATGASLQRADLEDRASEGDPIAADCLAFLNDLDRFPFYGILQRHFRESSLNLETEVAKGDLQLVLEHLLGASGLDYDNRPKALVEFHRSRATTSTAADEQLAEATMLIEDRQGRCRIHFSVPPGTADLFRERLGLERDSFESNSRGTAIDLDFSEQAPSTDTISIDEAGRLARDDQGKILVRPGGHGSLLSNLGDLGADIVLLKNIDNVVPAARSEHSIHWQRLLLGALVRLECEVRSLVASLSESSATRAVDRAHEFLHRTFDRPGTSSVERSASTDQRATLLDRLQRPLRVCGMVPRSGEPGGGPFWVRHKDGRFTKQIVESIEVSPDENQQSILESSTHFNPVLLALSLRDAQGRGFPLARFRDSKRYFLSSKSAFGETLRSLERPGLWNGSMAGWNTAFIEVPAAVFNPVKSVFDLLRSEHQAGSKDN